MLFDCSYSLTFPKLVFSMIENFQNFQNVISITFIANLIWICIEKTYDTAAEAAQLKRLYKIRIQMNMNDKISTHQEYEC